MLSPEEFHYSFTNTLTPRGAVGCRCMSATRCRGLGLVLFQAALANSNPHAATRVDFEK